MKKKKHGNDKTLLKLKLKRNKAATAIVMKF